MIKGVGVVFLVALFFVSFASAVSLPSDGLVSYWKFNEASGNVLDEKGLNGGIVHNATRSSGLDGNALVFDGDNDYVEVANSASLNPLRITVSTWVNFQTTGDYQIIIGKDITGTTHDSPFFAYSLQLLPSGGNTVSRIYATVNGQEKYPTSGQVTPSVWNHILMTHDGSTLKLYLNGVLAASEAVSGNLLTTSGPLRIGTQGKLEEDFKGKIDEVMIYNRALSESEIKTIYDAKGNSSSGVVVPPIVPPLVCKDSDGINSSVKGIFQGVYNKTTVVEAGSEEYCWGNHVQVMEAFCNADGSLNYTLLDCPNGCDEDNGICLPTLVSGCIDTDGGKNIFLVGNISGNYTSPTGKTIKWPLSKEICSKDANGNYTIVREGYCVGNELKIESIACPDVCFKGACFNRIPPRCTDSEGTSNYEIKGSVEVCDEYNFCNTTRDYCVDSNTLGEVFCIGKTKWDWEYDCIEGCVDGKCLNRIFTDWKCSLSPARCPAVGNQTQTCVRSKLSNSSFIERKISVVSCVPGVCSGCESETEGCVILGARRGNNFCSSDGSFKVQSLTDAECMNDYECASNVCASGICTDLKTQIESFGRFKSAFSTVVCAITTKLGLDRSTTDCINKRFTAGGSKEDGSL